jgi:hypothetical protein
LYSDFLLTFDNCVEFNETGDVVDEAASVLSALPLIYAKACAEVKRAL